MQYKCMWINSVGGYVVYRHFDDLACTVEQMAMTHRTATFVCESEALDYCAYRNEMMEKYGTDAVEAIERPNEKHQG